MEYTNKVVLDKLQSLKEELEKVRSTHHWTVTSPYTAEQIAAIEMVMELIESE